MRLYTIGPSNRTLEAFVELLTRNPIEMLVDIRAFPHSRSHPQFDHASLPGSLHDRGLGYRHVPALDGNLGKLLGLGAAERGVGTGPAVRTLYRNPIRLQGFANARWSFVSIAT